MTDSRYHEYIEYDMCDMLFKRPSTQPFGLSAGDLVSVHTSSGVTHRGVVHSAISAHIIIAVGREQEIIPTTSVTGVTPELFG